MYKIATIGLIIGLSFSCSANGQEKESLPEIPPEIFNRAIEAITLLTDEEIKQSRKAYEETKRAENAHLYELKPIVSTISLSSDPSSAVPIILTKKGANTLLTFIDETGEPWKAELISYGSDAYKDGPAGEKKRHVVEVVVDTDFTPSTLGILLEGKEQLINFMLLPSKDGDFDLNKTFIVPGRSPASIIKLANQSAQDYKNSPMAKLPLLNKNLNLFLDNIPPKGAENIQVTGVSGVQAWKYKGKMIVRANKRLNWPSASPLMGLDEYRVYELPHASPVLTFISAGKVLTAHIPDDSLTDLPRLNRR